MSRKANLASLALALLPLFAAPAAQAQQMVSIDRPEVNMRSGAGTGHEAIWKLNRGYPLIVIGHDGGWLKVRDFENDEGWVAKRLTAKKPHFVVRSTSANMRSGPGTQHRVVGKAAYGEVLRTVERRSKWAKVRNGDGLVGWVSRALLWGW